MTLDPTQTGPALPPWSLTAAGRDSDPATARAAPPGDTAFGEDDGYMFGADGLTFMDFLDIINPLQHLPVVSTLYRAMTGDAISPGARMLGGAIFGGPTGFAAAIVNNAMADHTGRDVGETVLAAILPDEAPQTPEPALALAAGPDDESGPPPDDGAVPPAALTTAGGLPVDATPLFVATGRSPLLTPERTTPLIDRAPRPQPMPAPRVALQETSSRQIAAARPAPDRVAATTPKPEPAGAQRPAPAPTREPVQTPPTPLDPSLIPEAMLSALEKYEQMKRGS